LLRLKAIKRIGEQQMVRGEITGRKPRATADPTKRRTGPPSADPGAVEPTLRTEPDEDARAEVPPIRGPPTPPACYSIATFCAAHHLSQRAYFKMKAEGWGPTEMRVGTRVLISFESAARWRAEREAAAQAETAAAI
jgi:hypothetical protein